MEQPEVERLTRGLTVQRDVQTSHRCLCVLVYEQQMFDLTTDRSLGKQTIRDACTGWTENPDSPLCFACIQARHDIQPHVSYTEVQASRRTC